MLEKTKAHLKKHKTAYLVTAGVVAGVVLGAVVTAVLKNGNSATQTVVAFKTGDVSQNVIQVVMTRPGPKSFVVQCLDNQATYPSLRAAAAELGINPGELSKHLSGKLPTAGGLTFAKLAEI